MKSRTHLAFSILTFITACAHHGEEFHRDREATYIVVANPIYQACGRGDEEAAMRLLDADPTLLNARDNVLGDSPLGWATRLGHTELVVTLLKRGADSNVQNFDGDTPLMIAAYEGYLEVARTLLEHGARIDTRNMERMTALHGAVFAGRADIVSMLIDACADVQAKTKDGETPLQIAVEGQHPDIAELLKQHGAH